jgi:O-succinylbenzoic acid--CoA ligase
MVGYANPQRRPGDGLDRGWLATSDLACLDQSGELHVFGRADDALVIGGVNVLPAAVETRLSSAPGIESIAVVGVPDPVWGRTLAACYVGDVERRALQAWSSAHLPSAERPRLWVRRERLPVLPSGKLDRAAIERLARRLLGDPGGTG